MKTFFFGLHFKIRGNSRETHKKLVATLICMLVLNFEAYSYVNLVLGPKNRHESLV